MGRKRWSGRVVQAILLLCGIGILAGHVRKSGENTQEKTRQQLVLWSYYETEAQQKALDELTEGFYVYSEEYEIRWEYVPMTEFSKRLSIGYTENALPDLVIMDNPDMPYYINTGLLADISILEEELEIKQMCYPVLLDTVYDRGRLYGLPWNCNNTALIYHTDMRREAGVEPPSDWEEFAAAVDALKGDGRYGFLMSAVAGEQGAFQILPWILSTGEEVGQIGAGGTVRAYDFLYGLIESGGMDANCINYSQIDVARKFISGEAAMMENGPWVLPMLEKAGLDYGIVSLPMDVRRCSVVGGENIGILRGKNTEGATEFLRYCARDEVMKAFCDATGVLPAKKALGDGRDERMDVFAGQMESAVLRTENEHWNTLRDQLPQGLYEMMAEGMTAQEAAARLVSDNK